MSDRDRVVSKLVQGSEQHFVFGSLLSEQCSYPGDLEEKLAAFAKSQPYSNHVSKFRDRKAIRLYDAASPATVPANRDALEIVKRGFSINLGAVQELPRFDAVVDDHVPSVVRCQRRGNACALCV